MKIAVNWSFLLVTVVFLLGFALAGFLGSRLEALPSAFWVVELFLFLLGIAYVALVYRLFPWALPDDFWPGLVYLLVLLVGGAVVLSIVYNVLDGGRTFLWQPSLAVLPISLPYLFFQSYRFWIRIPTKQYQRWQYPVNAKIPVIELIDPIAIDFRVSSVPNQEPSLPCSVNAPRAKSLSTIVHYLIYDYNTHHPQKPIVIYGDPEQTKLAGWVFQTESPNRVLDPAKSLQENQLTNGMVITARSFTT